MDKKGAMELSVGAIVVLIIAITFLSIGLVFIKGMLGKTFVKFDEQISTEPEPQKPSLSHPLTLSRNPIKTKEDSVEVLKISTMNPSKKDWVNRQYIRANNMCGKADGICFIDKGDQTGKCDNEDNSRAYDSDCKTGLFTGLDCEDNGENSPCLMSNIEGEMYCPAHTSEDRDPDCSPKPGAEAYLNCDKRVIEEPFVRNIGNIKMGDFKTNILLLRINKKVQDEQYLCQIRVFGEDNEYMEDLVVRIENE